MTEREREKETRERVGVREGEREKAGERRGGVR